MNASLIILANIHNQCSFSFLFLFKTPFLSTTKSCTCVKSDTKQKPPPYSTELGLQDGISVSTRYPVRVKLQSYQPQPLRWPATTIFPHFFTLEQLAVRTLIGWVCASCFLIIHFLSPRGPNAVFWLAAWSYNISPLEGILFFACVKKSAPIADEES